jgi:hypothetical protein
MDDLLSMTPNPTHQADATRRDQALQKEIRLEKIQILRRPQVQSTTALDNCSYQTPPAAQEIAIKMAIKPTVAIEAPITIVNEQPTTIRKPWTPKGIENHTERIDRQDNLRKMEHELQGKPTATRITAKITAKRPTNLPPVDIYCIGAVGFYRTLIKPNVTPFVTSLYEIDRIIEQKEIEAIKEDSAQQELSNEELIEQKLPRQHYDSKDVFSKAASDLLAPHREYDLKIELEKDHNLSFSPLY